ncbi:MAG: ABC transporter permease subunit [Streptosporangiales bacterium]|nr:ABC transporter permease subunit [Streptosporangiales bacterium]
MTTAVAHSWFMTLRHLRALLRQPWWIAITLVQPVIWLLIFSQLFRRVVEIPGFASTSYITFLTPGIVVMTALFSNGWSGMGVIDDLNRGVMDRFLVTPVRRGAVISGRLVQSAIVTTVQALIIIGLGLAGGARFGGGLPGIVALLLAGALLGVAFGALSNALALLLRREESVIAASNFILLPLTFLSTAFMPQDLAPDWIGHVARYNPVNWAIVAGREALQADVGWMTVFSHLGYLAVFAVVCGWLATRAFRTYQRSV